MKGHQIYIIIEYIFVNFVGSIKHDFMSNSRHNLASRLILQLVYIVIIDSNMVVSYAGQIWTRLDVIVWCKLVIRSNLNEKQQ